MERTSHIITPKKFWCSWRHWWRHSVTSKCAFYIHVWMKLSQFPHECFDIASQNFIHRCILAEYRALFIFKVNGLITRSPGYKTGRIGVEGWRALASSASTCNPIDFQSSQRSYNIQYFNYHYHHYNDHHISKFWQVRNLRLPFHYLPKFSIFASMFVCLFVCLSVRFVKHNSWTLWHIITKLGPHMEWVSSSSMWYWQIIRSWN